MLVNINTTRGVPDALRVDRISIVDGTLVSGAGPASSSANLYVLNASNVNIRKGPGTAFASYGLYQAGTIVEVLKLNHSSANGFTWAEVKLSNGSIGYVASIYLTKQITALVAPAVLTIPLWDAGEEYDELQSSGEVDSLDSKPPSDEIMIPPAPLDSIP
jgi:hypothetical protein